VRRCLELLPRQKESDIRTLLADALLAQMAEEGIEPVRKMIQDRSYDPMISDPTSRLVAVSTLLGVTFPELPAWKRQVEEKAVQAERRMKEMASFMEAPPPAPPPPPRPHDDYLERKPTPFLKLDKAVGRNDPCPCGSGKKFKKCCLIKNQR
jgi:hypothetical protein